MGYSPQQVDAMGAWQFKVARAGYAAHHGAKAEKSAGDVDDGRLRELGIAGF